MGETPAHTRAHYQPYDVANMPYCRAYTRCMHVPAFACSTLAPPTAACPSCHALLCSLGWMTWDMRGTPLPPTPTRFPDTLPCRRTADGAACLLLYRAPPRACNTAPRRAAPPAARRYPHTAGYGTRATPAHAACPHAHALLPAVARTRTLWVRTCHSHCTAPRHARTRCCTARLPQRLTSSL